MPTYIFAKNAWGQRAKGSSRWRGFSIYLQTGASVPAPAILQGTTATSPDTTLAPHLLPVPALRPAPSPRTMESLSDERQEQVQMLMALTGIENLDAHVVLQENEPDNSWQLLVTREDHAAAGTALVHAATAASAASPPSPGASLDSAAAVPAPVAASPAPTPDREREKDNLSGDEDRDDHKQSEDQLSETSAALSPPARGYPIGRNEGGERVYTQGDAVIADTLATYTPRARGMMLLAERMSNPQKMSNPRLTL